MEYMYCQNCTKVVGLTQEQFENIDLIEFDKLKICCDNPDSIYVNIYTLKEQPQKIIYTLERLKEEEEN